jgi:signal transduction histidine kinase
MRLGLKVIEEEKDLDKVSAVSAELRKMLGQTLDVVSGLARDLRPSVLDDMGLEVALIQYINNCSNRLGLRIGYHIDGLDECRFPSYLETAVYRIVQEGLTNVMKHANAENVSVVVRYDGERLTAIVEDDGIGFSMQEVLSGKDINAGLGLFGMQERAVFIGGVLEIESSPGKGTTVYIKIPWKGESSEDG